jgi:hypothetical protein
VDDQVVRRPLLHGPGRNLTESAWAITACTYVVANSPLTTLIARGWETFVGGAIGIAVALLIAPLRNVIRRQR